MTSSTGKRANICLFGLLDRSWTKTPLIAHIGKISMKWLSKTLESLSFCALCEFGVANMLFPDHHSIVVLRARGRRKLEPEAPFIEEGSNVRANDAMVCQSHYRLAAICGAYLDRLVVWSPSATQPD
jgi:hypothetical protein